MDAPPEGTVESESCNEIEDEKSGFDCQSVPAYLNSELRRKFLQQMVKALPPVVQNRITVLKNLQLEQLKIEADFFEEVSKLERSYHLKYQLLFDKRKEIIEGTGDPDVEKPNWKEPELNSQDKEDARGENLRDALRDNTKIPKDAKGIPEFWLTVFRNTAILSAMVQPHDEPAMRKLTDITINYNSGRSYTLEFHFDKNEFFTNPVLTKQYVLKSTIDPEDPFSFEGPEIYKCTGCTINWEKKMNLTLKTIRKNQKHKDRDTMRTVVKHVPTDSFFNFFNPPEVPANEEIDEECQQILATDFEIGHFLRARIIPKAVLYFTGDIVDDEDDEDEEFEGEDDDSDDDEEPPAKGQKAPDNKKQSSNDCPNQ
ncbi:nucleosome assembly protein 1-like 1-A [Drosophila bipectinata]|uniref:nucleosome assembly protein 1-like 1-A n=1 Tax=Drosophila bipectinata TaxID=42026 RepID=UPI001C8A9A48|nr:nucleosome assembly protein 1-like 1-A [Drosophila bipectinata]